MKVFLLPVMAAFALAVSVPAADVSAKLSDVHICCKSCVTGAEKAVATVPGAKAAVSQDDETVTITGADKATVQKAVDALTEAGYFGKCDNADIKVSAATGAKGAKVTTLEVSGVHLCCAKCATAVDKAVKAVPGVTGDSGVAKNAKTFTVTGDFSDKDVMDALQKAGLTGKVGK
jgi:periplasmic mercuric ion binding protein